LERFEEALGTTSSLSPLRLHAVPASAGTGVSYIIAGTIILIFLSLSDMRQSEREMENERKREISRNGMMVCMLMYVYLKRVWDMFIFK